MSQTQDSDDAEGTRFIKVTVSPDPGFKLTFDGMVMTEELGRPFLIQLELSSGKVKGNITSMLGTSVTIELTREEGGEKHYFNGILARIGYGGLTGGAYRYHVELRPWIWLLSRVHDCKIFQKKSVWDIILSVFRDAHFSAFEDKRQNQAGSTVLEYCVQYRESSLDFVTRLMEQFGLYYYTTHTDGEHKLVLADDPNSHTSVGAAIPYRIRQTEQRAVVDIITDWATDLHLQPGAYTYRDYNFTTPSADLTAKSLHSGDHPYDSFEIYDYPGPYETVDDGQKLVDVRMQDITARLQLFHGSTNARAIRSGSKFTLSEFPDTSLNQEYLIVRATITLTMAEGTSDTRGDLIDSYRVELEGITGTTPFRLDQRTKRPMIRGPQTAKVVGESGEEITTDQYGRIKVKFFWDRDPGEDQNSSCWIRVAQSSGGAGWGSSFIPRHNMEVVVEFLEGNPDRPLVTGVVYNATQTKPYELPANKTRTVIKSNSSKGGGGSNELRFEDKKGEEEVFFHAQFDYNKVVLNNETHTITKDSTSTVKEGNRAITVTQGNDSKTVSAGNHKMDVSAGKSDVTAAQSITMTVGGNSIKIDTSSITMTVGGTSVKMDASSMTLSSTQISGTASGPMALKGATISLN